MTKEENKVSYNSTILNTSQVMAYWQPTPVLRWKRINIDKLSLSYNKVLQQMWQSSTGLQEWRDVPEED